jgi:predicted HTH domain antitoxin
MNADGGFAAGGVFLLGVSGCSRIAARIVRSVAGGGVEIMTAVMQIDCGPELVVALGRREAEVEQELRLASALKLFDLGRISSGLAARLANVSRVEFLHLCGQYNVSIFQQNEEELASDVDAAMGST